MNLSTNFTLEEMTRSQNALRKGIDNTPTDAQIENGKRLCVLLLEPARASLCTWANQEVKMHTDSGFRCPTLNKLVGGSDTSAHLDFLAADIIPMLPEGLTLREAFDHLRQDPTVPYDQIILECDAWIHFGMAKRGRKPRRQAKIATKVKLANGKWGWDYTTVK